MAVPVNFLKPKKEIPQIFIGYDDRQTTAYEVCRKSIIDHSSGPVDIYPLDHRDLRRKNLFWREWIVDPQSGNYLDKIDGLPFSNQFSQTRFLVPQYCNYLGIRQYMAMFVDLDFVFFDDVYRLFGSLDNSSTVSCVKHEYTPPETKKMDNQIQSTYPKKLWSSLMVFNIEQSARLLTLDYVNTAKSSDLHRFNWVDQELVGSINEKWNFIPNHSEPRVDRMSSIHYTEGLPDMFGYETSRYARLYIDKKRDI